MSNSSNQHSPPGINKEVDLILYIKGLFAAKFHILLITFVCALASYGYSLIKPDIYESYARLDVVDMDDPGGVAPDARRASEVLTLVEHGFVMGTVKDNHLDVILTKLRSRDFTLEFMERVDIYPHLYSEHWDSETQQWRDGFVFDKGAAFKHFHERIRFVDHNPLNDIVSVRMRWTDPLITTEWANEYVRQFNDYMRQNALIDVDAKLTYLNDQLQRQDVVDIQKSIYRLIEAQTAVAMIANSKEEYALEVLDAAQIPFDRYAPGRKTYALMGAFAGLFFSVAWVIGSILFKGIRRAFAEHEIYPESPPSSVSG